MINQLFARFQRPERGWDPVPAAYARDYAERQWRIDTTELVDRIERETVPLDGREVLDLGAGPGHFTLALAERGARVTWFDISRNYQGLARERLVARHIHGADGRGGDGAGGGPRGRGAVEWQLGYLDEAVGLGRRFDLVFSRICWYYCIDDRRFARQVHAMVRPGGWAYIVTPYLESAEQNVSFLHRVRGRLNDRLRIKIGHPFPTRRLFERVWRGMPTERFDLDVSPRNVTVRFKIPGKSPGKSPGK